MAHVRNKGPRLAVSGEYGGIGTWLADRASKAALVDLYLSALARAEGLSDADEVPADVVIRDADPTLRIRGDRTLASHAAGEARRAVEAIARAATGKRRLVIHEAHA